MANRTIYVADEALYARAQAIAASHGRSLSDVISGLIALYVRAVDHGPTAPAGVDVYRSATTRARGVLVDLELQPGDCDRCAGPGDRARISFDLTVPGAPMTIGRYCADCSPLVTA
ncbi:hypothetical protein ABZ814_31880 [Micromonospora musae]|uniref:hypothetical protein n=1 Tax=Micromonospora musae TaxID=1894970 RepID=UPI0033C6A179